MTKILDEYTKPTVQTQKRRSGSVSVGCSGLCSRMALQNMLAE